MRGLVFFVQTYSLPLLPSGQDALRQGSAQWRLTPFKGLAKSPDAGTCLKLSLPCSVNLGFPHVMALPRYPFQAEPNFTI